MYYLLLIEQAINRNSDLRIKAAYIAVLRSFQTSYQQQ